MKTVDIQNLRRDYKNNTLDEGNLAKNPIIAFKKWFQEALESNVLEPNAMTLSTAVDNIPDARIVLLKDITEVGFVFYTNYDSKKGKDLSINPNCSLTFNWLELERQVRIQGVASKLDRETSEQYFKSRPIGSQMGAHTSPQSQKIPNREYLENLNLSIQNKFKEDCDIPIPDFWGGFIVIPSTIEFWQGRPSRLHDRIQFILNANGLWETVRLAP